MAYKIFLDTNILIDLLDDERLHHTNAIRLINEAENGNCTMYVTESVLNTTAYLVRKDYPTQKLIPLFNHLLSFVEVIPVNTITYQMGLHKAVNDIEDAILYAAALAENLNYFITNDLKDLRKLEVPKLPVLQAKDFIKLI